jgi:hypothetical protein
MLRGCGIRIVPLGVAVLPPFVVAAGGAAVAAFVASELASPLLATLAAGLICLATIACILAVRPELLRQLRTLRSGASAAQEPAADPDPAPAQDPVVDVVP